jgi:hypothetical protein
LSTNVSEEHTVNIIRKGWYLLTSGGRSVGIVRLWTEATEFKYCHLLLYCHIIMSVLLYYIIIIMYYYTVILVILYYYINIMYKSSTCPISCKMIRG